MHRPVVSVRCSASSSIQASMSTSPVSCCWAMAANSPFASRLSRAATAGSSADARPALSVTPEPPSSSTDPMSGRQTARKGRAYHRGVSYARDERTALCALLDETGPGAPTLCEGWRTVDLAAHLVMRERRPDAAAGLMGGPLAGHTRRVTELLSTRTPFPHLVQLIRSGPPPLSVSRL